MGLWASWVLQQLGHGNPQLPPVGHGNPPLLSYTHSHLFSLPPHTLAPSPTSALALSRTHSKDEVSCSELVAQWRHNEEQTREETALNCRNCFCIFFFLFYKLPRWACSRSIASKSALKLPVVVVEEEEEKGRHTHTHTISGHVLCAQLPKTLCGC
jgi:hypothetical protein